MAQQVIGRGWVYESTDVTCVGRIPTADGTNLIQDDITGTTNQEIGYFIYNRNSDTPRTVVASGTLAKTAVIYDTLQDDGWWGDEDETGYNFRATIDASQMPQGGALAIVEFTCNTTSFGDLRWRFDIRVREVLHT